MSAVRKVWRERLRGLAPARPDPAIHRSLTAKLLQVSPGVTLLEALLVGLIGGIGAWRVGDPVLWALCLATTASVLILPFFPRQFEKMGDGATVEQVRRIELRFAVVVWTASAGIGCMTARALLAFDDPILHLSLVALTLGAAVTTIRDHYRPLVPFGKTIALLGPPAAAAALTGQLHYQVLAIGGLFLIKIILDLALELYRSSLEVHEALADKAALAETLRVRADELQRLRSELIAAARLTAMGTMASALAHELNQPLAAASNYVRASRRLLESGSAHSARLSEGLVLAEEAAQRAGEIVRRIRGFVSGEGAARAPEDLADIVDDACTFGLADERAQAIRREIRIARGALKVMVDRIQIQQVLMNLLQNAVDALEATPEPRITISAHASDGFVMVTVADNGAGISDTAQETLFEPFRTTKGHGIGLGLAISRTIIEAHEGRLFWSSKPDCPTEFRFSLPLAPQQASAAA